MVQLDNLLVHRTETRYLGGKDAHAAGAGRDRRFPSEHFEGPGHAHQVHSVALGQGGVGRDAAGGQAAASLHRKVVVCTLLVHLACTFGAYT